MAADAPTPKVHRVRLLDEDPELGADLSAAEFEQAREYAVVDTVRLRRGIHNPGDVGGPEMLGLLVLDGLLVRSVLVAERACGELVGPGALVRPWDHFGQYAPMPFDVRWRVIESVTLAMLDTRIATLAARWPELLHGIVKRAVERSHALALNVAIHSLQHVELRLLVLLWHLADRYGRVTPDGVIVPLKLSHSDLAELIGSQRPSVSARLADLSASGRVVRRADRTWMLCGDPPTEVRDMRARADRARAAAVTQAAGAAAPGSDG